MRTRLLTLFIGCLVAVTAVVAVGESASAGGDSNHWSHGEDGMYMDNNPFPDDEFPGYSPQNRSGVV